jgi:hypothetical protein
MFPLYLVPDEGELAFSSTKSVNLSVPFLKTLCSHLMLKPTASGLPAGLTPEDIFHYAYAVFHSPGYRSRYAEFLKIDFPRLPLTGNLELFRALARLGGELTALHLLESPKLDKPITEFIGGRNPEVEKISWSSDTVWVDKAQATGFRGVREDVWNFHIGGYQVCEKWLKDRKGRTLTKDDLAHYQKIVVALSETIRLMAEIDKVIEKHGGWPGAFAGGSSAQQDDASPSPPQASTSRPPHSDELPMEVEGELPLYADKAKPAAMAESSSYQPIEETTREEVMCAIRRIVSEEGRHDRESLLKRLSEEFGYQRLGPKAREILENDIQTAVRRGILKNENGSLSILCRSLADYDRNFLKEQFLAAMGRGWMTRGEATQRFIRWMGFSRMGDIITATTRSLTNCLLREKLLEARPPYNIRRL